MEHIVCHAADYGLLPGDCRETTLALRKFLDNVRKNSRVTLEFTPGTYHFYPDYAYEKLLCISNHDEDTLKRIIFDLSETKGFHLIGNGAEFLFHTDCIPFYAHKAENLTLEGFSVDYVRPSYSEAEVLEVTPKTTVLRIDCELYPYEVRHGRLVFLGENFEHELTEWLEFDQKRCAPVYNILDMNFNGSRGEHFTWYEETGPNTVAVHIKDEKSFLPQSQPGNRLVLRHHPRSHPGFYVTQCEHVTLLNVQCHHATGIAFMAERSRHLTLSHFNVCRSNKRPRIFTAAADATHFVYCGGKITIQESLFENQLDDAVNIHGIYARIKKVLQPGCFVAELVHPMQKGVCFAETGEMLRCVDRQTMLETGQATIKSYSMLNRDCFYMELQEPVDGFIEGNSIENISWVPNVEISRCTFRNNRARGLLLTSAGNVLVEGNLFQVPGAAILMEGDANNWFESGTTQNIVISDNTFDNCSYVPDWGYAPIQATPRYQKTVPNRFYHQFLMLDSNRFLCFDDRLLHLENVGRVCFTHNKVQKTTAFAPRKGRPVFNKNCGELVQL